MAVPVLVTRPQPGAAMTAARLQALGFLPVVAPLLRIETFVRTLPAPETLRGILIASQQAIPALPDLYHDLPLYAVGDATAAAARGQGFKQVQSADGKAEDLAALIIRDLPRDGLPLLLATGTNQGYRLKTILQAFGFEVMREEVYAARSVTALPVPAMQLLSSDAEGCVLLFSRETALCFHRVCIAANLSARLSRFRLAAISHTVAEAVRDLPWATIHVAMDPHEKAVLALLND
ncbi:uroporphyrinogen-III synthase [Acidisoma cellulosilytica]|uniref:Uroporphyrinogen-III synthase n=1 Tax=Acidisoma cellulosilyticum TaxID=2802395 RepID=A0A963Z0M3_9PROT|nr:uroporphyrinogen-III synthase [Acidisoma cellulosilyticum]MCB8879650.1 uroporphyrinogen-III synthase [Acidisoma cellulosilyticum]